MIKIDNTRENNYKITNARVAICKTNLHVVICKKVNNLINIYCMYIKKNSETLEGIVSLSSSVKGTTN